MNACPKAASGQHRFMALPDRDGGVSRKCLHCKAAERPAGEAAAPHASEAQRLYDEALAAVQRLFAAAGAVPGSEHAEVGVTLAKAHELATRREQRSALVNRGE